MERYDDCPQWWKLERDTGLRTGHPAADVGKDFHRAAEARYLGEPPPPPIAPLSAWQDSVQQRALAAGMALDLKDLVGIERHGGQLGFVWEFMGPNGERVWVHFESILDRLHVSADGRALIVDYKTGFMVPKLIDDNPQGLTYCVNVLENYPWVWDFTFSQYQTRYDDAKTVNIPLEKVIDFRTFLAEKIQAILLDTNGNPTRAPPSASSAPSP